VLVESELLWSLSIRVVNILLESNAEWKRDDLISLIRKGDLFRWRLTDHVLIVQHLSLHDHVVVICSKLASGELLHFIIEALTNDQDVGVLANWARVGVEVNDAVRGEGELTLDPGVAVEGD
jgi:hypothetical protein